MALMPASYLIDDRRRTIFSRAWGVLTDGGVISHNRTLIQDPRFRAEYCRLADFREVTELRVSADVIQREAALLALAPTSRRAFVVSTDLAFGFARMFQLAGAVPDDALQVVRDLESGMAWIGLEPDTPWPAGAPDGVIEDA